MNIIEKHQILKDKFKEQLSFELFLWQLTSLELQEVLDYILLGDQDFLELFFSSEKNLDLDELAFDILLNQPYYLIEKLSENLNVLFTRATNNLTNNPKRVIKKIITLGYNNVGLSNTFIIDLINNREVCDNVKIDLLFLLDYRKQNLFINKYIKDYDLLKDPFIFPFIIAKLKSSKIIMSELQKFDTLNIAKPEDQIIKWFNSSIYDVIQNFTLKKNFEMIFQLKYFKTQWINELVKEILLNNEFFTVNEQLNHLKEPPKSTVIDQVRKTINEFNKKYSKKDLAQCLISTNDAEYLFSLSQREGRISASILPNLRDQVTIGRFQLKGNYLESFNKEVSTIRSLHELTSKIETNLSEKL